MRRTVVLALCAGLLSACGGGGGGGGSAPISSADLADQQDHVDAVARDVVASLVAGMGAVPPAGSTLGRGLYAGCDGGDPDEASYFVDTFVTYDVRPDRQASDDVAKALAEGDLALDTPSSSPGSTLRSGDATIDLTSQDKGGGSAGQNIFVSSGCLAVGQKAIAAFNAANGRDVPVR